MASYVGTENNEWKKALAWSSGIYIGILLLLYFVYLNTNVSQTKEVFSGGIEINYGTDEVGAGTDYTSMEAVSASPNSNARSPIEDREKVTANKAQQIQETERKILTQDNDDNVPSVKSSNNPEVTPKPIEKAITSNDHSKPEKEQEPVLNTNALYKGDQSKGTSAGDGTGDQAGNQGARTGNNLSTSYEGTGSGGGGIALNLAGRRFIARPVITDNSQSTGKIAVNITVGRDGLVKTATAGARGTTLSDAALWRKCEQAALKARLNAISNGPELQAGTIIFTFILR